MSVENVFGAEGLLSQKFPGYAPRKGQVDMATAVEDAIRRSRHLLVEGPTGTGKSLAYLVPAIENVVKGIKNARGTQNRVIVVTANIALQEQLVQKDLPLLASILPQKFTFALAKGKSNYVCLDALGKTLVEAGVGGKKQLALAGTSGGDQLDRMLAWAQSTETGDVSEFPETPGPGIWRRLSVGSDECKGRECRWIGNCFSEKAKAAYQEADVVVTNYHLFFAHLLLREKMKQIQENGGQVDVDVVLPPAAVVVFDEAHKAADIARDFLGFSVGMGSVDWLVRQLNHESGVECKRQAERFFSALVAHKRSSRYRSRLKQGHGLDGETFARSVDKVAKLYKSSNEAPGFSKEERAELETRARRATLLAAQVRQAMRPEENEESVYFLEESEKGAIFLKSKPIDVSDWMAEQLFAEYRTTIVTSATLATGSGDPFAFVKKEIGLDDAEELLAESPFDFEKNVLLVVPSTMCDPKDREVFPRAVAAHVAAAALSAKGRTLGLFTSYKNLEAAAETCRELPYRVYRQGELPRTLLMKKFKEETDSILLGCESFWAGVDVPGESLSCVVIDRLPFPTPDDPIVDALSERSDRWFFEYAVPRAIIQIKQGFGRLIRTETDRGVVVILDRRMRHSSYSRQFLRALPSTMFSDDVEDVGRFLDGEES